MNSLPKITKSAVPGVAVGAGLEEDSRDLGLAVEAGEVQRRVPAGRVDRVDVRAVQQLLVPVEDLDARELVLLDVLLGAGAVVRCFLGDLQARFAGQLFDRFGKRQSFVAHDKADYIAMGAAAEAMKKGGSLNMDELIKLHGH